MQLVWVLLIAAAITVFEILIYRYHFPRFFLFIFPLINICLEICIVFFILRQQALVTSIIRYGFGSASTFCRFCYPCLS